MFFVLCVIIFDMAEENKIDIEMINSLLKKWAPVLNYSTNYTQPIEDELHRIELALSIERFERIHLKNDGKELCKAIIPCIRKYDTYMILDKNDLQVLLASISNNTENKVLLAKSYDKTVVNYVQIL